MLQRLSIALWAALLAGGVGMPAALAQSSYHFDSPGDDQWQYPFNASVGTRTAGSVFLNAATATFDLRDAIVLLRWDTSAQIPTGQEPSYYDLQSLTLNVWNKAGAVWPATTEVQLYGVGYGDVYDASAWNELSTIVAGAPPIGDPDRDPYPITLTGKRAENSLSATPWALGNPVSYTPGAQATPFKIEFIMDMQNPVIRAYVQAGLREGQLTFAISTDHLTAGMGEPETARPTLVMKEGVSANPDSEAAELDITLADPSLEALYLFSTPSDDQWQYPFNSTVGTRPNAPIFLTPVGLGFDRRDGVMLVRWDTSSLIKPYAGVENYDVEQVTLRLWHRATATWGATDTVQIQLFGVGYGPTYDAASWNESSPVKAAAPGPPGPSRDPYPMTLSGARAENDDQALPWAVGVPIGYNPDGQTRPFAVDFELDLDHPAIFDYVRNGLNEGQLTFAVSTNQESFFGAPAGFDPYFITKEGVAAHPGSQPPSLSVRLGAVLGNTVAHVFDTPVADRWWYPYNGTPGTRERGGIYWENFEPYVGVFNFRGGQDIFKWNSSASIPSGLGRDNYKIKACRVTVWNLANASWDLEGFNSSGLPKQLEIFGLVTGSFRKYV